MNETGRILDRAKPTRAQRKLFLIAELGAICVQKSFGRYI